MKEGSKVPRRGNVPKREVLPDPMYRSVLVTKLINSIKLDGKTGVAQKVVYGLSPKTSYRVEAYTGDSYKGKKRFTTAAS